MNKIPLRATLVTREGFKKIIELDNFQPHILVQKVPKITCQVISTEELLEEVSIERMEFHVIYGTIIEHKDKKGKLQGIEAEYEEM